MAVQVVQPVVAGAVIWMGCAAWAPSRAFGACMVLAAGVADISSLALSVNGLALALDAQGRATFTPTAPGRFDVLATATEGNVLWDDGSDAYTLSSALSMGTFHGAYPDVLNDDDDDTNRGCGL